MSEWALIHLISAPYVMCRLPTSVMTASVPSLPMSRRVRSYPATLLSALHQPAPPHMTNSGIEYSPHYIQSRLVATSGLRQ